MIIINNPKSKCYCLVRYTEYFYQHLFGLGTLDGKYYTLCNIPNKRHDQQHR